MSWYVLLDLIQANSLVVLLVALSIALCRSRQSSAVVAALVVIGAYFVHLAFDIGMGYLFESQYYTGDIAHVAARGWYLFYSLTDFLVVFCLYQLCKKLRLKANLSCVLVAHCYIVLGTIQTARFIDRFVFNSDFLSSFYELSIPIVNLIVIGLVVSGLFSNKGAIKE